jgi:geranylgeranyl diphosphate synthase type I
VETVQPGLSVPAPRRPSAGLDLARVKRRVGALLDDFLTTEAREAVHEVLPPLVATVRDFAAGSKRLRPVFCYCGWAAAGGGTDDSAVIRVGAGLELLHCFALIHDDVVDGSAVRRGRPAVHRLLARGYREDSAERFGVNAATLLGDLCFTWADRLLDDPGDRRGADSARWATVRSMVHAMRTELCVGQYLDLAGATAADPLAHAWSTIRHKTAGYTIDHPLRIGAALAGAGEPLLRACEAYGRPLGEAFQLRDDLLGVFGDPAVTGKSALDDFREGKTTVLMALTRRRATPGERAVLAELHGNAGLDEPGADRLRAIIRRTGADTEVAELIGERVRRCRAVLERGPFAEPARRTLADLVRSATHRKC